MNRIMCVAAIAAIAAGCSGQATDKAAPTAGLPGPPGNTQIAEAGDIAKDDAVLRAVGDTEARSAGGQPGVLPPVIVADHWAPYRSFRFDDGRADIRVVDRRQIADIAAHLVQNPTLRLGIDNSVPPGVTDAGKLSLGRRRIAVIREALLQAGTPAYRIEMGAFADPRTRREQRVELLLLAMD